ncbi:hypothetical protein ACFWBF_30085 [Streptomyces sp. NPDC060028]|uniref:TRADD-N-associated membrane domain-containing protein n=1 Tax=Streptomyces sp. NPDC060028 TaxID=3347041 RepID=UPI00369B8694
MVVAVLVVLERVARVRFDRRRDAERERLLAGVGRGARGAGEPGDPKFSDVGGISPSSAELGDRRDDFTPLLVEYYAYGLTQARTSFATSQWFAGAGAAILLAGIGIAVWKAESSGELYLGVVTSSVGLVVTVIGQLFHRRADLALGHMADQTASLREDRRAAETMQQAILLLDEVADQGMRARLQAGLIMKLSGAELPQ